MKKENPDKEFIPAPPKDSANTCNECVFMRMNTLEKIYLCLKNETPEIFVDEETQLKAVRPIKKCWKFLRSMDYRLIFFIKTCFYCHLK